MKKYFIGSLSYILCSIVFLRILFSLLDWKPVRDLDLNYFYLLIIIWLFQSIIYIILKNIFRNKKSPKEYILMTLVLSVPGTIISFIGYSYTIMWIYPGV